MTRDANRLGWTKPGTAVITGASSGIGEEFARQLAAQGFRLLLVARRQEKLDLIARELERRHGIEAETFRADLADAHDRARLAARLQTLECVDLLVNNAGFGSHGDCQSSDLQHMLDMIAVHDVASVQLTCAVLDGMIKRGRGGIIFTASIAASTPTPGMYSPTKAFLVMLAHSLDVELTGTGVRAQALCPGFTHTEFHSRNRHLGALKASLPKAIWGRPDKVVRDSLEGLRRHKTVVVPGAFNKLVWFTVPLPVKKIGMKWRRRREQRRSATTKGREYADGHGAYE
jgi:short-subunit dehydrogenase